MELRYIGRTLDMIIALGIIATRLTLLVVYTLPIVDKIFEILPETLLYYVLLRNTFLCIAIVKTFLFKH